MKRTIRKTVITKKLLMLFIVGSMVIGIGCKKEETPVPTPVTPTPAVASLSAVVNGSVFTAKTVGIEWTVISSVENRYGCIATDAAGNELSFSVRATQTGTYTLDNTNMFEAGYAPAGSTFTYLFGSSNTGTVTFTKMENVGDDQHMIISGTFSFTVECTPLTPQTTTVTQGKFENVML